MKKLLFLLLVILSGQAASAQRRLAVRPKIITISICTQQPSCPPHGAIAPIVTTPIQA